jgi:hypothetical protein
MRKISFALTALVFGATALPAQTRSSAFELRPFAGATIPTGAQRDLYKDAPILGMGVAYQIQPNLHIVGNFGWMREHTKYAVLKNDGYRYSYDAGVELSMERRMTSSWMFRPYVGVGRVPAPTPIRRRRCCGGPARRGTGRSEPNSVTA